MSEMICPYWKTCNALPFTGCPFKKPHEWHVNCVRRHGEDCPPCIPYVPEQVEPQPERKPDLERLRRKLVVQLNTVLTTAGLSELGKSRMLDRIMAVIKEEFHG
jgi:hypothetical protein